MKDKFANTFKFCESDLSRFALLLRKGVKSYEYMDKWLKFHEDFLHRRKVFIQI